MRKDSAANAMGTGATAGVDLGDRFTQICLLDAAGTVVLERRLPTRREALERFFQALPALRVALEAGTHSPWIARVITGLGHEVLVANPRRLRSISGSVRKSDRVDAEQLARLARSDPRLLSPITHRSERAQEDLALIHARDLLVRTRTALAHHVRCTLKSFGILAPKHSTESFAKKMRPHVPRALVAALVPVIEQIEQLTVQIRSFDRRIEAVADERYQVVARLSQIRGVGRLTALAYVLVIADASRFQRSRHVGSYLGLAPRRRQSGDRDPQLRITKAGDTLLRRLLVGCAHYILGPFGEECDLRAFGQRIAERGGPNAKKRAIVAVARKLATVLHRLWVTGKDYEPCRQRGSETSPSKATASSGLAATVA
jgi:transposase